MAAQLWNRVNIPFPSAVSSVRVHFSSTTDASVQGLLVENEKLLNLIRSEILQTEIRVLYELLYILNNSSKGIKTFKALKQVEQCINRLKSMKLDVALQELRELCPTKIQRRLSIKAGECDVPSQPMLEWLCLKVLGAAQLMSCTLNRCSRAFLYPFQRLRRSEMPRITPQTSLKISYFCFFCNCIFHLVGLPLTDNLLQALKAADEMGGVCYLECGNNQHAQSSLVSAPIRCHIQKASKKFCKVISFPLFQKRFPKSKSLCSIRVIFRGVLVCLSALYQQLLELLREVADAQPMPFLTDFSLPADLAQFLDPSALSVLSKRAARGQQAKGQKEKQQKRKQKQGQTRRVKEDLGVAVERDIVLDSDMKPFLKVFRNFTEHKSFSRKTHKADKKHKFKTQVREASTFSDLEKHLDEMILWCKSQKMGKEKRLLIFLHLKSQRMKCLEAAGYNVQKKLRAFRQEALWALSPQGSVPKTCLSSAATRRNTHQRTRFHSLRSLFKSSAVRTSVKRKQQKRRRKRTEVPESALSGGDQRSRIVYETTSQTTGCDGRDDIDDIFASVGL